MLYALAAVLLVAYIALAYVLGKRNVFFTLVPEARAIEVKIGERLWKFIAAYRGYRINRDTQVVLDTPTLALLRLIGRLINPLRWPEFFGIYWMGIYPIWQRGMYKFEWVEPVVGTNGDGGGKFREEPTPYLYLDVVTYMIRLSNGLTDKGVPVYVEYLLPLQIVNLFKARYGYKKWLEFVTSNANTVMRDYVGSKDYFALTSEVEEERSDSLASDGLSSLNSLMQKKFNEDVTSQVGVRLMGKAKIQKVGLADPNAEEELKDALNAAFVGKEKGRGELELQIQRVSVEEQRGNAELALATKRVEVARKEAERIQTEYGAIASIPGGTDIRRYEALEKASEKGSNTNWVVGDFASKVASVFTGDKAKKPDDSAKGGTE